MRGEDAVTFHGLQGRQPCKGGYSRRKGPLLPLREDAFAGGRAPQSVGQLRFREDLTYFLDACTVRNSSTQTSASGDQPDGLATRVSFLIHHLT